MTVYNRGKLGEVKLGDQNAAYRKWPIEVGTDEAQIVTIQKNSESSFSAASSGTCTQVSGTLYELALAVADLDEAGLLYARCSGATDIQLGHIEVSPKTVTDEGERFRRAT